METIVRLERWFAAHCNGDWEHGSGISIETVDNPGWSVRVDLTDTPLEHTGFPERGHGLADDATTDWLRLWIENGRTFRGVGDPSKLDVILRAFLDWAES